MKLALTGLLAAILAGCAIPDPMDMFHDNRFAEIVPDPAPPEFVGTWTGSNGPYLMTVRINVDGTGLYCSTSGVNDALGRIKIKGDHIYYPEGGRMALSMDGDVMVGAHDYQGAPAARFVRDDDLVEAAPYCAENL